MVQCFKVKSGTKYAEAVARYFELRPLWKTVFHQVGECLRENIKTLRMDSESLGVDMDEITKEENKTLFTRDGQLKKNGKRAREVAAEYKRIISEAGLEGFETIQLINFTYGVMRYQGDLMESWTDNDGIIYFKTSFDLEKRSQGAVEPITEIEYEERYLEQLKSKAS